MNRANNPTLVGFDRLLKKRKFEAAGAFLLQLDIASTLPVNRLQAWVHLYRAIGRVSKCRALEKVAFGKGGRR